MLSFVIPCYNTEACIVELLNRIKAEMIQIEMDHEIIFVDDCSPQRDHLVIKKLASDDPHVKLIRLIRNFGQQKAITAGLSLSKGDWVIVMDADLEDDPVYIPELLSKAKEGYDIVFARRMNRKHSMIKKMYSKSFHFVFDFLTDIKTDASIGNYGIYSRRVVEALLSMREQFRTFGLLIRWLGFPYSHINVEHGVRHEGKSSYSFKKGIILALDAMIAFSDKPLKVMAISGFGITIVSLIIAFIYIIRWFWGSIKLVGWTSTIISIWFFGGIIIMGLGIIGLYVGRVFEEAKQRPHYVIDYMVNIETD